MTSIGALVPARVASFLDERQATAARVLSLAGDASTRQYFRVCHESGATEILALSPEPFDPQTLPFLSVQRLLAGYGLPVPRILAVDGPRGVVLQQDLGDVSLLRALEPAPDDERLSLYREALGQIARLQQEAGRGPREAACFALAFDLEKLSFELDFFLTHFICGLREARPTPAERAELKQAFYDLSAEIASWPRVLCHRDYHGANLMRHDGRLHWIDFQDARMGPATYDVASLLRERFAPLPDEAVLELAETFREVALPGESREVFGRRLGLVTIQRSLKALGSFGFMATVRGHPQYLAFVETGIVNVRRELSRQSGTGALRRALVRHIEELQ